VTAKRWALACAALSAAVGSGCGASSDAEEPRPAQIYVATIELALEGENPTAGTDKLPVVYVVPLGETDIDATVQAAVASELHDVADVRFADKRSEAVQEDEPGMPVRDNGVLVGIGDVAEDGGPVDVQVEDYRSEDDWSKRVLTFVRRSSQWAVTSTLVVSGP
jgi:hypothetical protein